MRRPTRPAVIPAAVFRPPPPDAGEVGPRPEGFAHRAVVPAAVFRPPDPGAARHQSGEAGPRRDGAWESSFARLQAFAAAEGHARVPAGYHDSAGYWLGRWVRAQRDRHRKGQLAPERAARLSALPGWSWAPPRGAARADGTRPGAGDWENGEWRGGWEHGFTRLQDFAAVQGHARVPARHCDADGYRLGVWVKDQRRRYRGGTMPADLAARLAALPGWIWDADADAWDSTLARVAAFAAAHGHARVPARHHDADGYRLGAWVTDQRRRYRRGTMPGEQAARLAALPGWDWDALGEAWENALARVADYAAAHADALVPAAHRDADGYRLGAWVAAQRYRHRQGTLPPGRAARLAAVPGWSWSPPAGSRAIGRWESSLARLAEFAAAHGHASVPARHHDADGYPLGQWVRRQRQQHARGTLEPGRAARLAALPGWSWQQPPPPQRRAAGAWAKALARLQEYAARHGHADVAYRYRDDDGFGLGEWAGAQRARHARGELAAGRVRQLEQLPGWTWRPAAGSRPASLAAWDKGLEHLREFATVQGHARVPAGYVTPAGYRLGRWVYAQRHEHRRGTLDDQREKQLAALPGWTWEPRGDDWNAALERLRTYAGRTGTAAIGPGWCDEDGFRLGWWAKDQRDKHARGLLAAGKARRLEQLPGWSWRPPAGSAGSGDPRPPSRRLAAEAAWDAALQRLRNYVSAEGHAAVPSKYAEPDGYRLGQWVYHQRRDHQAGKLDQGRADKLAALPGWSWGPLDEAWEAAFGRLRKYVQREGRAVIGPDYRDDDGFCLGAWARDQRQLHARGTLATRRARRLAALPGWSWDPRAGRWEAAFERLRNYVQREGSAVISPDYRDDDGFWLGAWARDQRHNHARGTLDTSRARRLAALPGWSWAPRRARPAPKALCPVSLRSRAGLTAADGDNGRRLCDEARRRPGAGCVIARGPAARLFHPRSPWSRERRDDSQEPAHAAVGGRRSAVAWRGAKSVQLGTQGRVRD